MCLGTPQYIGKDYLAEFTKDFDFQVLDATDRTQAISKIPELIERNGPIEAFIVRMGTPPYEPFDFFGPSFRRVKSSHRLLQGTTSLTSTG